MMASRLDLMPLSGIAQPGDELDEALAIPVVGRVPHEAAKVALGIAGDGVVVLDQRVVVDVDQAGVRHHFVFGVHRPHVVAVDDGMDAMLVHQPLRRSGQRGRALVARVHADQAQRASVDPARRGR